MYNWYTQPITRRAPAGGSVGLNGKFYRGGEFEPFYVPRSEMPQIDDDAAFAYFAATQGVIVEDRKAQDPYTFQFHQRAPLDRNRLASIPLDKPVLVSADGYVLDGNHRLAAHQRLDTPVDVMVVPLPFEEAIELLFACPGCYTTENA